MTSIQPVYYSASLSSLFTSISAVFQHFSSPLSHSLQRPSAKCINFKKKEWQTLAQKNSEKNKFTQFVSMYSRHCVILLEEFIPIFFFLWHSPLPLFYWQKKWTYRDSFFFLSEWYTLWCTTSFCCSLYTGTVYLYTETFASSLILIVDSWRK